jgi:hypothetical protein
MKNFSIFLAGIALFMQLAACDNTPANRQQVASGAKLADQEPQAFLEKPNAKFGLTALFYGQVIELGGEQPRPYQDIGSIVIKDTKTGKIATYAIEHKELDFYFTDVWSPDGAYLVVPLGKLDGFAIYNAKTAVADVKARKPADTIRVWTGAARRYWHVFDGWAGPSTFRFKTELETSSFPYQYDIGTRQLSCTSGDCGREDHARNIKGDMPVQKPVK